MGHIPRKYIPKTLSKRDYKKQQTNINHTRKLYKKKIYVDRPKVKSFKSKQSPHVKTAKKLYGIENIVPSKALAKATKCSIKGLRQITKKGRGAYYSSGSRPNQTAQSWARARLASTLTGGKASLVDYKILESECHGKSPALLLAKKLKKAEK
uniref:DUF5824 domain-containing protein n=1 Tax=viral metagenome TaxID=1070528 RepID=A0A6C0CM36_9ZZZZ